MTEKPRKTADKLAQQMRGEQARAVIENPIWQQAFAKAEKDILDIWAESLPEHIAAREQYWHLHQALKSIKEYLEFCMVQGENARKEMLVTASREKQV